MSQEILLPEDRSVQNAKEYYDALERIIVTSVEFDRAVQYLRFAVNPRVTMDGGVKEAMTDHLKAGGVVSIPSSHGNTLDPLGYASICGKMPMFEGLRNNVFIPAKDEIFNYGLVPKFLRRKDKLTVIGRYITYIGAKPVMRIDRPDKENPTQEQHVKYDREKPFLDLANERLVNIHGQGLANRISSHSYPSGSRKGDKTDSGRILPGIWQAARIAEAIIKKRREVGLEGVNNSRFIEREGREDQQPPPHESILYFPSAISWSDSKNPFKIRRPRIHIGTPLVIDATELTDDQCAAILRPAMQKSLDRAMDLPQAV